MSTEVEIFAIIIGVVFLWRFVLTHFRKGRQVIM